MCNKPSRQLSTPSEPTREKREPVISIAQVFLLHLSFLFWRGYEILARSANRSQVQQIYALVSPSHTHIAPILLVLTAKKELSSWMAPSSSLRSKLHKAGAAAALSWLTIHDRQTRHLVASPLELVGRRHLHSVPLH